MSFDNIDTFSYTGLDDVSWNKPLGVTSAYFILRGGGGAGNSANASGGGGAYLFSSFIYLAPNQSYQVLVNVGGGGKPPPVYTGGKSVSGQPYTDGNYSDGGDGTRLLGYQSGGGGGMTSVFYMEPGGDEIIKLVAGGGGGAGNSAGYNGGNGGATIGENGRGPGGGQGGNSAGTGNAGLGGTNGGVNGYSFVDSSLNDGRFSFLGGGGGSGGTFAGGGGGAGFGGGAGGRQGGGGGGGSYATLTARNAFIAGGGGAGGGPGQAGENGSVTILYNTSDIVYPPPIVSSFMLNPQHTNQSPYRAASILPLTTQTQTYQTTSTTFPNSGVVGIDNVLYIVAGDGQLYAFNRNFTYRWGSQAPSGYTFIGTPVITGDGTLYIAARTTTTPNYLFALIDKGPGINGGTVIKWKYPLDGNSVVSPVRDLSGVVYIGTTSGSVYAISDSGNIATEAWKYNSPDGYSITGTPVLDVSYNRLCYTSSNSTNSNLYVLDLAPGNIGNPTLRFTVAFSNDVLGTPSIDANDIVYVASKNGYIYAYDIFNNIEKWQQQPTFNSIPSIAISNENYICFVANGGFVSMNSDTGAIEWKYNNIDFNSETMVNSIPIIDASNNVYFGGLGNYIYSLQPITHTFNWRYPIGGVLQENKLSCMPIISNDNNIYFGANDGKVYDISGNGVAPPTSQPILQMYMLNPQHTGLSTYYGPAVEPLTPFFRRTYNSSNLFVSPSMAIANNGTIYFGSNDGKIYAINPNTGLTIGSSWPITLQNDVTSIVSGENAMYTTPLISPDGTIYIGSNEGKLYALNPTGSLKWKVNFGLFPLQSSPIMDTSGSIYFGINNFMIAMGDAGYQPYTKWANATFDASDNIISSPALGTNGYLYFASVNGWVYALNSFTGAIIWSYNTGQPIYASPTVDASNNVIVGNGSNMDGSLYYLDGITGLPSPTWTTNPFEPNYYTSQEGPLYNTVAVHGNTIYLSTIAYVYAINRLNGIVVWNFHKPNFYYTSPIVDASGNIYVASITADLRNSSINRGMLHSIKNDGTENWNYDTGVIERLAPPVLSTNRRLYLTSTANNIYAFGV
jgi:outer membrane protein assembly factor BamB